jgi:regulator of protease activity HflC (stomatin/prohibitin superfamily)
MKRKLTGNHNQLKYPSNKLNTMKLFLKILAIAILSIVVLYSTCTRIEPGYVGIKVNQAGSAKGVEDYPLHTGWVFYLPITTRIYEYPTFQQNVIWTASPHEGKSIDESISFNCKGGAALSADVSMSAMFIAEQVPHIFVKFRTSPEIIIHSYLRNEVRDALGRVASTYDPMDIIGEKRGEFLDVVKKEVESRVGEWMKIDYITFANKLRVDSKIETSINTIIEQKQQTAASLLKVAQKKAEADQKVSEAEGEARAKKAIAQGDADAITLKAEAQAKANRILAESLTPVYIQYEALIRWDGKLPTYNGSGLVPFINIGATNR